jgi:hypothetical protein
MGFFKSITKIFKKVAKVVLPVAAVIATGGAALGAMGMFAGAGAAGLTGAAAAAASLSGGLAGTTLATTSFLGGIAGTIGRGLSAVNAFTSGPIGQTLKLGGQALNAFGSYQTSSAQADLAGSNARIAAMNAQELVALYDLNKKAYTSEKVSITDAAAIRKRDTLEKTARAARARDFGQQAISRDLSTLNLSKKGIQERQGYTEQMVAGALENINVNAAARLKEVKDQQQDLISQAMASTGALGIRQNSDVVTSSLEELQDEVDYTQNMIEITRDYERSVQGGQSDIRRSETEESLSRIGQEISANDQRKLEISEAKTNADFDAALELEISGRNTRIALDRVASQEEGAKIRYDTAKKTIAAQEQAYRDQQEAARRSRIPNAISSFSPF